MPMAMNIRQRISSDSTLYIYDVHAPFCEKFRSENSLYGPIKIVSSACEVAEVADVIISIVPAASHVRTVYLDNQNGIIAAKNNKDRLMLECSTIDAQTARDIGKAFQDAASGTYVDTPVSVSVVSSEYLVTMRTHTETGRRTWRASRNPLLYGRLARAHRRCWCPLPTRTDNGNDG